MNKALTITNAELDAAIDEARANAIHAWYIQSIVTVEDGYTYEQAEEALRQAEEAQVYYEVLYNEREARDMLRHELAAVLREINVAVYWWIQNGPWVYSIRGEQRIARAQRLVDFCRNHNMPFEVESIPNGVAVKFWRNQSHKSIIAPRGSISTITPNSPRFPAGRISLGGRNDENVYTTPVALQGAGGA